MTTRENRASFRTSSADDDQIDVHRYIAALSRSRKLIAAIVGGTTLAVVVISLILPKSYTGTAKIVFNPTNDVISPPDALTQQRELQTIESLLTGNAVLSKAARPLHVTPAALQANLHAAADSSANIISVSATSGDPRLAAQAANSVAGAFLAVERASERRQLAAARQNLVNEIRRLEARGAPGNQLDALRHEVNDLSVREELAGSDLQLAARAQVPTAPSSPRPLRNGVLAFFVSLFAAILIALARDQLRPRINSPRELSRLTKLPVLASVPYVRAPLLNSPGRGRRVQALTAAEHEAYQALQASLRFALPKSEQQVLLVTSAVHGEGKTTATSRLGRALAHAGQKTLLISADLRYPGLHNAFRLSSSPGLANLLEFRAGTGSASRLALPATVHHVQGAGPTNGAGPSNLDVLTSGDSSADPAQLLTSDRVDAFFETLRATDYDYVVIDSPPLLGIADAQALIREVDSVLVVARLDRVTTENVIDTEEILTRLEAPVLGLVVIGARSEMSPYYLTQREDRVRSATGSST